MIEVSVVMPMRNAAPYVEEAVRSVLAQSMTALELVVVDDGCTDRSRAIVESVGDPRVRIVEGPQQVLPGAWNAGLAAAGGRLFVQCDSDDRLPPGRLAWQVRFLAERPQYLAVCGGMSTVDPAGRSLATFPETEGGEEITDELRGGRTRTSLCTYAVPTETLRALGGMRPYFESSSDIDLQFRIAETGRVYQRQVLSYVYRLHDKSLTHGQEEARCDFFEAYAQELARQRQSGGADDLQRGCPRPPPARGARPMGSAGHRQGMLLGEAWRVHGRGQRWAALKLGLRALGQGPASLRTWRSVLALVAKTPGPRSSLP
jgi:glycosyltransferase involved in cell wall biosynthesis